MGALGLEWISVSTLAIQRAIDAVAAKGGGEVFIPASVGSGSGDNAGYKISASLMLKPFVNLRGEGFSSCIRSTVALQNGLVTIMYGPGIAGRYIRDIRLIGADGGAGIGTNLLATATSEQQCYGFDIACVSVESCEIGMQLQGLWHTTLHNCTTSTCRVGLDLWGQNVSLQINGCHFRRDSYTAGNTFGILIHPRVYAWSPDQTKGSRSEAIIINGETMCISVDFGLYVDDCLDLQVSNFDFDFIRKTAINIINVNGGCNIRDGWIAGDSVSTSQFFGISIADSTTPQGVKSFSGINMNLANANSSNNNVGLQVGKNNGAVMLSESTIIGGWAGLFILDTVDSATVIDKCVFPNNSIVIRASSGLTIMNTSINKVEESFKPTGTSNNYINNTGAVYTAGLLRVPMASAATTGTAVIKGASGSGLSYLVKAMGGDSIAEKDTASVSNGTVTVNRPVAGGVVTGAWVEYRAI